jgi:HlyD family secretion protein
VGVLKKVLPLLLAVLTLAALAATMRGRPPRVQVVRPVEKTLAEAIALSGRVRGVQESQLAPEVGGTVRALLVSEGQLVKKGQKLAVLDTGRLRAQRQQALEKVRVAEAQLAVARRGPLPSEVEQAGAEVQAQRLGAQAALRSAQEKLLEAQRGPRSEQVEQARASLQELRVEQEQRTREAQRQSRLLAEGAVSTQSAEQAQTLARRSAESVQNASARLAELRNGTRPEEVEQARQAVASARADLLSAQRAGEARLQQLRDQPRPEDISLAQAQVREARSAAELADEQLRQAQVVAPYDGVVGRRLLRVGDLAGPTQPIFTFSSRPALEIRVEVDESDRARLALGLKAEVRCAGFPGSFTAEVKELAPEVDPVRGTIEARLAPVEPPDWLVPGQTVDVNLILEQQKSHLILPLTCVVLRGDKAEVTVIEDDTAHLRQVEISSPTAEGYLIRSGLRGDEWVALAPQGLREGQRVRWQSAPERP